MNDLKLNILLSKDERIASAFENSKYIAFSFMFIATFILAMFFEKVFEQTALSLFIAFIVYIITYNLSRILFQLYITNQVNAEKKEFLKDGYFTQALTRGIVIRRNLTRSYFVAFSGSSLELFKLEFNQSFKKDSLHKKIAFKRLELVDFNPATMTIIRGREVMTVMFDVINKNIETEFELVCFEREYFPEIEYELVQIKNKSLEKNNE